MTASSQYVSRVCEKLICAPARREKFIQDLRPMVADFASEKPDASLSDFEEAFGAPAELAQQYMSTLDQEEVRKYKHRKGRLRWVPKVIVAIIIVVMVVALLQKYTNVFGPHFTFEVTTLQADGMSIEEMKELMREMGYAD